MYKLFRFGIVEVRQTDVQLFVLLMNIYPLYQILCVEF